MSTMAQLQQFLEQVLTDPWLVHDHEGRLLEVSAKTCERLGYSREELLALTVLDIELSLDTATAAADWGSVAPGAAKILGARQRRKDGKILPVEVHCGAFDLTGQRLYFRTARDLSPRLKLEAELHASRERVQTVFRAMTEGLVLQSASGEIIEANPAAETILGVTRAQLLGKSSLDPEWRPIREDGSALPGEEHPAMVALRTGEPVREQVMGFHDPGKGLRWIRVNARPIFSEGSDSPAGAVTTFVDITAQRRLTDELRVANADLRAILDNVPARITSWRADRTNRFINRVASAYFQISPEEAIGKHVTEILGVERYAKIESYVTATLAGERQAHELADPLPCGTVKHSYVEYVPNTVDREVVGFYVLGTDNTELRESYARVRELAQRLEGVREEEREAAALVLHEGIAQDLFAMKLGVECLRTQSEGRTAIIKACQEFTTAIEKCMHDTRRVANQLRPAALVHLRIVEAVKDHARYFGERAGLDIVVNEAAPFPRADAATQSVLFRTAQEALTNVARHARATRVEITFRIERKFVVMSVADDGVGIEAHELTKVKSLGLLGIRERVRALGGDLSIVRGAISGSVLSVRLPTA